ncbi:hypothetical protein AKJ44_02870, partial [candidate division MSBL1 archaeon SCGC-AAA261F17]
MRYLNEYSITAIISVLLVIGLFTIAVTEQSTQEDESNDLKKLLVTIDGSIKTLRLRGENSASDVLEGIQSQYNSFTSPYESDNFDNKPNLVKLNQEIDNKLAKLKQSPDKNSIRELRGMIQEMANELGVRLSFIYENSMIIILGVSFILSLIMSIIIKIGVNWEKIRGIRIELKNWQDKLRQAQLKSKKKEIRKLKLQQGEMSERQNTILMTDLKQAILYLIPFVLAWFWLST